MKTVEAMLPTYRSIPPDSYAEAGLVKEAVLKTDCSPEGGSRVRISFSPLVVERVYNIGRVGGAVSHWLAKSRLG